MLTESELSQFGIDFSFEVPEEDDSPIIRPKSIVPIYTCDLETDPFQAGRYPEPFAADFYDGNTHSTFWGVDCIDSLCSYIEKQPPGFIYLHNGGRFDIYYLMRLVRGNPALIINGRIVRTFAKSSSPSHPHEIRDSYAIMPFALAKYKKDAIDISLLEKETREENREEIISYLRGDTTYLHELCVAFLEMFGNKLTIGSAAMKELQKHHSFESLSKKADAEIRSEYYYGGRVQCFEKGILKGPWKVYDVNSMYPYVMKVFEHPVSMPGSVTRQIRKSTCFVKVKGENLGAFPIRTKQGLSFNSESGIFTISIHEWNVAMEYDLFRPTKILECINFGQHSNFTGFVDSFYDKRERAKMEGDEMHSLFYKFVLNSAYGKFAQNTDKYMEYCITPGDTNLTKEGWTPYETDDVTKARSYIIWKRKPTLGGKEGYTARNYNCATGASITGAGRAVLLKAIACAKQPIYCDTDSIICKKLSGVSFDSKALGSWKEEATAYTACIGGKKLYALFDKAGKCVKQANKGVSLTPQEIHAVCQGEVVTSSRIAPSFHLDGSHNFITRKVRMT
jgi:DNA polymerase elongation subunit (family B)